MPYVTYEKRGRIAIITLNRPERMNALGRELSADLREAEAEFARDDDVWVGIYIGAGDRAFCAGLDLKEAAEQGSGGATGGGSGTSPISRFERIAPDHGKVTIAAINGAAYGGGLEMALTCDMRICSDNARMALAEVKVGLCPPGGSFNLPRLVGLSNAMWLLLSGEPVDADEALRMGSSPGSYRPRSCSAPPSRWARRSPARAARRPRDAQARAPRHRDAPRLCAAHGSDADRIGVVFGGCGGGCACVRGAPAAGLADALSVGGTAARSLDGTGLHRGPVRSRTPSLRGVEPTRLEVTKIPTGAVHKVAF